METNMKVFHFFEREATKMVPAGVTVSKNAKLPEGDFRITEYSWGSTLPPEGQKVATKIDDARGCRNEAVLVRQGNLWFFSDMSMYVYYRPTHWHSIDEKGSGI